ncbi:MAG: group I truncated hemoglobin [Planctomycetota bacterium]|jgi:hemoglobin
MSTSLYDQLGGFSSVRKLVSSFYDKVLDDEDVAPFFENTSMSDLIDHQTKFWAALLGGPASYTDEQLHVIHATMGVKDNHFETIIELAVETLEDEGIDQEHIDDIAELLTAHRPSIVIPEKSDG